VEEEELVGKRDMFGKKRNGFRINGCRGKGCIEKRDDA
jgi:hypothetical protein